MNKYVWAVLFGVVAMLGGVVSGLSSGTLTNQAIFASIVAGLGVGIFKLMDPNSIVSFPPIVTGLVVSVLAVWGPFQDAMADGKLSLQEAFGLIVAFLTALYAKISPPAAGKAGLQLQLTRRF